MSENPIATTISSEIVKPKMTLPEILEIFRQMDEGLVELSVEEMQLMGEKAAVKVDNYKEFLDRCETEAIRLTIRAEQFAKAAGIVKSSKERVEKMMLFFLQKGGFESMPGEDWIVKVKTTKSTAVEAIGKDEPNSSLAAKMPTFIRRKYEWDKKAIGAELKKSHPNIAVSNRFQIVNRESHKINWTVRKGIEK